MNLSDIQTLIDKANHAYYSLGKEVMDDSKYDSLKDELKRLSPSDIRLTTVGSSIRDGILQKAKHTIPMGSLNKASNEDEWKKWLEINKLENSTFLASYKMDGGSISLEYKDGKLKSAITRGDGIEGEDVTANALKFKNIPLAAVLPNGKMFNGFIRGEVVLLNTDWKEIDPVLESNPRNLGVGILRRKDGSQAEYLSFYAFRIYDNDGELLGDLEQDLFGMMIKMGFDIAPYMSGKPNEIWTWFNKVKSERSTLPYLIDGLVCSLNDLDKQSNMGVSSNCPKGAIAIKFPSEGAVTTLHNVTWQVGGSGTIAPVAHFNTVKVGGVNISNATLCNFDYIKTLGLHINDEIKIVRAGDVIPRVMEVAVVGKHRVPIKLPEECPCCNGKVGNKSNIDGNDSTALYCLNDVCPAVVVGRIDRYLSSLNILGIGTSVIEALVSSIGINNAADLYTLHNRKAEIADMTLNGKVRMGEKRAEKLIEEIENKRSLTISDFLGSLSINGLGKRRVGLIQTATHGKMDKLENWMDNTLVKNAIEAGVPNLADSINKQIIENTSYINQFIANGVVIVDNIQKPKNSNPNAKIICITGKMPRSKKYYYDLIEQKGNIATDTFSKDINYLVTADLNSTSSKMGKAKKYGIPIIDEDELMKMLQS